METKEELMERICEIDGIVNKPGATEAPWYEPWNLILNWLRARTDRRLTIAPQCSISHLYYKGKHRMLLRMHFHTEHSFV
jgi:hypothetical protein